MKFKDLQEEQEFMYPGWDCLLYKIGDKALEEEDFYDYSDDDNDDLIYIDFDPEEKVYVE